VLHLCGYKDKSDLQSQEMRGKENYYLRKRDF
jgi:ssRNA-specific RNase YbeY (16S rRNA maturation enzyme)